MNEQPIAGQYNINKSEISLQEFNMLQIRLDTQIQIDQLEAYLRGYRILQVYKEGTVQTIKVGEGKQIANEQGVQQIMSDVQMILNAQVVQGNFDQRQYDMYIKEIHVQLIKSYVANYYKYGIPLTEINNIINKIMFIVQPFMTRTLNNLERVSYPGVYNYHENRVESEPQPKRLLE